MGKTAAEKAPGSLGVTERNGWERPPRRGLGLHLASPTAEAPSAWLETTPPLSPPARGLPEQVRQGSGLPPSNDFSKKHELPTRAI